MRSCQKLQSADSKSILINEKQELYANSIFTANLRQKCTEYKRTDFCRPLYWQTWAHRSPSSSSSRDTLLLSDSTHSFTIHRVSSSKSRWTQMVVNTANSFYKAVELSHKYVNRQTFCWLPRKLYRKFGTKIMVGVVSMGNMENLTIWQDMTPWLHDPIPCATSVQLHSKHDILERPSSEKPCVQYKSPHSCFIEKINIVSSQQSLYVLSQHEWYCHW